jgi:hypothetical protein
MSETEDRLSSIRSPSGRGRDFDSKLKTYERNVYKSWKEFEDILVNFDESYTDMRYLKTLKQI